MDSSEFYNFEDQAYINPKLSSGEQMAFIDKFRDIQNQNNQQIATDTYNLGKALPSNLGGLGGGESYFNARYQNDQVDDMVANLKTAAQAQELNDVMSNYQNQLKRRYSNAQRSYNRRRARSGSGGGNSLLDALKQLYGDPNKAEGKTNEYNTSGVAGILGEGRGIAASPSDVPDGETYSYFYQGAVDKNGNPIGNTKGNTVAQNSSGRRIWSDATTGTPLQSFSPLSAMPGVVYNGLKF